MGHLFWPFSAWLAKIHLENEYGKPNKKSRYGSGNWNVCETNGTITEKLMHSLDSPETYQWQVQPIFRSVFSIGLEPDVGFQLFII
jgi:hypothetical protein